MGDAEGQSPPPSTAPLAMQLVRKEDFRRAEDIVDYCKAVFPSGLPIKSVLRRLAALDDPNLVNIEKHYVYTEASTAAAATRAAWAACTWERPKASAATVQVAQPARKVRIVDNKHIASLLQGAA